MIHEADYTWSFADDIEPTRGLAFAQSYRVRIHHRPAWQCAVIRLLRRFGVDLFEYVIEVEVIE